MYMIWYGEGKPLSYNDNEDKMNLQLPQQIPSKCCLNGVNKKIYQRSCLSIIDNSQW